MKFVNTLRDLINRATLMIEDCVANNKGEIEFFKGIPEGDEDAFYDLPTITQVDKHYNYNQYGVLSIEKVEEEIIIHTKGRGDNYELKDFKLSEISGDDIMPLCEIADLAFKHIQVKK